MPKSQLITYVTTSPKYLSRNTWTYSGPHIWRSCSLRLNVPGGNSGDKHSHRLVRQVIINSWLTTSFRKSTGLMTKVQCWTELLFDTVVSCAEQLSHEYQRVETPLTTGLLIGHQVTIRALASSPLTGKSRPQPDYVSIAGQSRVVWRKAVCLHSFRKPSWNSREKGERKLETRNLMEVKNPTLE